ncbi:hypothetical protein FITA111629_04440 [Filibacter tadaridae]|uniref:Uncharacterized protein n=1 Tax=Filibacter tadaridae TaxID=2483811 RepID=A0A3P5XCZ3_9BACL|nr:hypothetical protein [Filibacter tadaridae]VDC32532.1 hypothetical protein FILTAD_02743 [Filibacter tadaridae]
MKRFLLAFVCLLGFFVSNAFSVQDVAVDDLPPITMPISTGDFI